MALNILTEGKNSILFTLFNMVYWSAGVILILVVVLAIIGKEGVKELLGKKSEDLIE